ncbi:MAG: hypothetical protein HYS75_03625 [Nitrosopumilales archaeon]|nr:hypothetical protein [Nitrosopumilales archaeon]
MVSTSAISYSVFFSTLFVVCISLVSVVFPALIVTIASPYQTNLAPFEAGPLAIPLVIANFVLIGVGLAYYKRKLPTSVSKPIESILNFEVSKRITIIVAIILLAIYIGFSIPELTLNEADQVGDYQVLKQALDLWPFGDSDDLYVKEQNDRYVRIFLLYISQNIFQNIKLLPFIASILLVILTYFFTHQLSSKRFAGLVSMAVLLQSYTFLEYDTIAVYENFWVLFYVLSLYVINKKWYFSSPILYLLSIFTKAFAAPFVFMSMFFVYRSSLDKKKKMLIMIFYAAIIIAALTIFVFADTIYGELMTFKPFQFWLGFTVLAYQLRFDYFFILTLLPLTIGLFIMSRKGIKVADSILILFLGTILAGPILVLLTDFYVILPYRFVPLLVFFSIGIGVFLSKKTS